MEITNKLFSENFFKEEERDGYTVSEKMKKIWAVELDMLDHLLAVCDKYHLKLYADGGTLLGAVRHNGFIPWDDDIDVAMFRDEYNELCKIADTEFNSPYFFQTEETDPGSLRGHAQLRNSNTTGILKSEQNRRDINQGIFIDIFPLDAVPDNKIVRYIQRKKLRVYSMLYKNIYKKTMGKENTSSIKDVVKKWFVSICQCRGDYDFWYEKYENECARYNEQNTTLISTLSLDPFDEKLYKERDSYREIVFHKFEMFELPVPIGYERILRNNYGDWRKYKIESSLHGEVLFDTEIDYKTYLDIGR